MPILNKKALASSIFDRIFYFCGKKLILENAKIVWNAFYGKIEDNFTSYRIYLLIHSDILADRLVVCVCVCIVCAKYIYSGDLNKLVIALGFRARGN